MWCNQTDSFPLRWDVTTEGCLLKTNMEVVQQRRRRAGLLCPCFYQPPCPPWAVVQHWSIPHRQNLISLFLTVTPSRVLCLFLSSCLLLPARESLWIRAPRSVSKLPQVISVTLRSAKWYSRHAPAACSVLSGVPISQIHLDTDHLESCM